MATELEISLNQLEALSQEDLAEWIERYLVDKSLLPVISRGQDPHHVALNAIYDQLSDVAQHEFTKSVLMVFCSTPAEPDVSTARRLYTLLQVMAHTNKWYAQRELRARLKRGHFRHISYAGWNLQALLLVTCCQYAVDDELVDFIFRAAVREEDFQQILIYLRMLGRRADLTPYLFIDHVLPFLGDQRYQAQFTEVLDEIVSGTGFSPLFQWYERLAPKLALSGQPHVELIETILRTAIAPWPIPPERAEPYAILLSAYLHSGIYHFTARDIAAILQTLQHAAPRQEGLSAADVATNEGHPLTVIRESVQRVLTRIWRQTLDAWPDTVPWNCVDLTDEKEPHAIMEGSQDLFRVITPALSNEQTGPEHEQSYRKSTFHEEFELLNSSLDFPQPQKRRQPSVRTKAKCI